MDVYNTATLISKLLKIRCLLLLIALREQVAAQDGKKYRNMIQNTAGAQYLPQYYKMGLKYEE